MTAGVKRESATPWAGRRCLVTGRSGAVGGAVANFLLERQATVTGVRSSAPVDPNDLQADLTQEASVEAAFDEAVRRHGGIDVLIHTVGGFAAGGRIAETSADVWDRMMLMNLRSTFLCLRAALRRMKGAPYGRVVLFGAATGLELPAERAAYAISKASVHHLASVAAQELRGSGVTVNAIAPRIIDTPDNRKWMPDADRSSWVAPAEICRVIDWLCDAANTRSGRTILLPGEWKST